MAKQGCIKHLVFIGTDGVFKNGKKYTYKEYSDHIGIKRNTLVTRLGGRQFDTDLDLRGSGVQKSPERKPAEKTEINRVETASGIISQKYLRLPLCKKK